MTFIKSLDPIHALWNYRQQPQSPQDVQAHMSCKGQRRPGKHGPNAAHTSSHCSINPIYKYFGLLPTQTICTPSALSTAPFSHPQPPLPTEMTGQDSFLQRAMAADQCTTNVHNKGRTKCRRRQIRTTALMGDTWQSGHKV